MNRTYKKPLAMLLALLILLSVAPANLLPIASAAGDKISWTFSANTLVVTGSGELSEEYTSTEEWQNMKGTCINLRIEGNITAIGDKAFMGFALLKNIEISSEITKIGTNAFTNCIRLSKITLPNTLTEIGSYAFSNCKVLGTIALPDSVTAIGEYAFADCVALKEITVPQNVTEIKEYTFSNCKALGIVTLPDSVKAIGEYAFVDCVAIKEINIPQNIAEIGAWAFKNCNCFDGKALVLPDTLQKLGRGCFYGANIVSLTTPFVGVGELSEGEATYNTSYTLGYMFGDTEFDGAYMCWDDYDRDYYYVPESLKEVVLTRDVYPRNFAQAEKVERIVIKDTVETTEIPSHFVFQCTYLQELVIENPDPITYIGMEAFRSCDSLETFDFPENITEIAYFAFGNCTFSSIELPQKLKVIGEYAFQNNPNLTSIVIPDSVVIIHDYAFAYCENLETVILPDPAPAMGEFTFSETKYGGFDEMLNPDFSITEDGTLKAYWGDDENVVVPEGVKLIGTAFAGNETIKSITLPSTLVEIEHRAFDGCKSITELVIPDSVRTINEGAFAGLCNLKKLTVPFVGKTRDVKSDTEEALIGYWFSTRDDHDCIYNCYSYLTEIKQTYKNETYFRRSYKPRYFTELTVTDSVLRSNALQNYGLTVLNLGANVTEIEEYAANAIGLEQINFDENIQITEIPDYAFCNNKITSITIPKSVKKIGKAFICDYYPDNKLAEINLNEGIEIIDGSFAGSKITSIEFPSTLKRILEYSFRNCTKLEYIEFPENMYEIGDWAFEICFNLKEVVFSDTIIKIGACAFLDCPITKVVMPENMTYVVDNSFFDSEELEIVIIGSNTEKIGEQAFANCPSLEMVVIPDNVTSISDTAFSDTGENLVIYCNEGSYAQKYAIQNNIKYTTLVLDAIPNQPYTGMAIEPTIGAKANNKSLVLNTDYTLSYSNNIVVGVANVLARGLGDFKNLVATGKFNIVQREIADVQVNFSGDAEYSPNGIEPDITLRLNSKRLRQGEDYEILGLDKIKGTGYYNITLKGMGNFGGTHNLTVEVLPRSIRKTSFATSGDEYLLTDSQYTLVKGVDYKIITRTNDDGAEEKYVVGIGNYNGEILASSPNLPSTKFPGNNALLVIFEFLRSFFSMIFGIFK